MVQFLAPLTPLVAAVAWHLGQLHTYEKVVAVALAFGPFVVLAAVVVLRRKDDDDDRVTAPPREHSGPS